MIILPSLEIVPAKFNGNILLSQIPVNGTGDFTVTRALNTATRVNSLGNIELVDADRPRLDYLASDGTVGCPALLVEPSGSNLVQRSEDFTAAFHTKFNLNAFGSGSVANTTATRDPYGTNLADYIQENSAAGVVHGIIDIFAGIVSGTTYTWSVFAKAGERTIINLFDNSGSGGNATFNLTTGVATLNSGVSASMQNYGNGWWRCRLTYTAIITGNFNVQVRLCDASGNSSYNGMGNQGAYIFGAQLETGSVATSYIPTTTAAVTRNADVISVSGAVSGSIGQTEGTIYAEVDVQRAFLGAILTIDDGDTSDFISILRLANFQIRARIRRANSTIQSIITSAAVSVGIHKIALAYTNGDYALYIDGVNAGTSTNSTDYPATSLTQCVLSNTNYVPLNDRTLAAALYPTRLTNTQLAFLTSPYTSYSSMASALSYTLG